MDTSKMRRLRRRGYFLFIMFILFIVVTFVQLPVYVTYPGGAEPLNTMVTVEGGYEETGDIMLTTVRVGKANIVQYVVAHFNQYQFLFPEKTFRREWESEEDYSHRQMQMMKNSQDEALIVAYELAGKNVTVEHRGVVVSGTIPGTSADKMLQVGDLITEVDGKAVHTHEELLEYLGGKTSGDAVKMTITRQESERTVTLRVEPFPQSFAGAEDGQAGVGIIGPVTKRVVVTDPPVQFNTQDIGGPSAGLMLTLEIYNQLNEKDLTKGYQIAGTGEIDEEGRVGAIGGIDQKVVAADKAGADVFFAPVAGGNAEVAEKTAKDIDTKMTIVPVRTVHDALTFLDDLQESR